MPTTLKPTARLDLGKITWLLPNFEFIGQHNLPEDLTSLIGRERDGDTVRELLRTQRIVTLVGVGGVGKTRLALSVGRSLVSDFADGVWLTELATLTDPAAVPDTVAGAIGVVLRREGAPLASVIGARRLLIVLDNCEHLIQACAELVEQLLRSCPSLKVLATSREPIGVPGEIAWPVSPLTTAHDTTAPLEQLAEIDAVRLFVERGRAARPDFRLTASNAEAVAQVCQRLDGLPLAIELAAARSRVLTPEQIAARLDDRFQLLVGGSRTTPARQQTLQATVAWSYELLDPDDRLLFDRLSVFPGSFSMDAAQEVCEPDSADVLQGLSRLADQSMLTATPDDLERRYTMLDTLRAFGRERLRSRGEEVAIRHRVTVWILARAATAGEALRGPDQAYWLHWAEREHDSVRAALGWSIAAGDAYAALGLVGALWWSWLVHDRWIEAEDWIERVLSMPGAQSNPLARGQALHGAGTTAALRGKYAQAQARLDASMAVARELGDQELLLAGDSAQALLRQFQGDIEGAQTHVEAVLDLSRRLGGRPWYEARAAEFVASLALKRGDLSTAAAKLGEAIRLARAAGDLWNVAMLLSHLGDVERMRGTHPRAAPLYKESIRLLETLGLRPDPSRVHNLGYVALAEGQIALAEGQFREAAAGFRRAGDPRGVAECLIGLGCVRAAERRPTEAARLFGAGEAELAAIGSAVWPSNRADYQHWARIARGALGEEVWTAALSSGGLLGADAVLQDQASVSKPGAESTPPDAATRVGELTRREREVAELAAQGLSNRRIAEILVIAEKTAANHLQNALDKLEVHSRSQLAARAVELGLAKRAP